MSIHVACLWMCVLFYLSFVCLHVCAYASKFKAKFRFCSAGEIRFFSEDAIAQRFSFSKYPKSAQT